jgi:NAD(P)-dependent dehydrogenase (short-subunit alcohol dehydrogenase family)
MEASLFDLTGRVAVVVGGARDLGLEMAQALASAGCLIAVTSRELPHAERAARQLQQDYGVCTRALSLDVTSHADVAAAAKVCAAWQGHVDVLINNAGGGLGLTPTGFFDRPAEHVAELINVNLVGLIYCCQEFGRAMTTQKSGKIINIASIAGLVGRDRRMYRRSGLDEQPLDYAAAKAGVIGLTRDLAALMAPHGVNVNAISPGGFLRDQPEAFVNAYSDVTPLGRMGRDGFDLRGAALFLASKASDYVTGHNLVVDGGFSVCK